MRNLLMGFGAVGALMLSATSAQAPAAPSASAVVAQARAPKAPPKADDVPAPPMALLFAMGAVGLIWGRRLAANAHKAREHAKPTE